MNETSRKDQAGFLPIAYTGGQEPEAAGGSVQSSGDDRDLCQVAGPGAGRRRRSKGGTMRLRWQRLQATPQTR